jgi:hypothetical protein
LLSRTLHCACEGDKAWTEVPSGHEGPQLWKIVGSKVANNACLAGLMLAGRETECTLGGAGGGRCAAELGGAPGPLR